MATKRKEGEEATNLVASFLAGINAPTAAQAVREMNKQLGSRYEPQDLYKWRRGGRDIPQQVQNYMLPWAIIYAIGEVIGQRIDKDSLERLTSMLSPPKRIDRL